MATLSFLLTIYILFLITYSAVIGFAVYKVFMFAKNKDLKGYSRRMTLAFLALVIFIFFVSLLVIRTYTWNDNFGFYCKQVAPASCFCETDSEAQKACQEKQSEKINSAIKNQLPKT